MQQSPLLRKRGDKRERPLFVTRCKNRVGRFNLPCNGRMEYCEEKKLFVCEDCGAETELV